MNDKDRIAELETVIQHCKLGNASEAIQQTFNEVNNYQKPSDSQSEGRMSNDEIKRKVKRAIENIESGNSGLAVLNLGVILKHCDTFAHKPADSNPPVSFCHSIHCAGYRGVGNPYDESLCDCKPADSKESK